MFTKEIKYLLEKSKKLITLRKLIVFIVLYVTVVDLLAVMPYVNVALTEYQIKLFLVVSILVVIYKPSLKYIIPFLYLLFLIKPIGESTGVLVYMGLFYIWLKILKWQRLSKD